MLFILSRSAAAELWTMKFISVHRLTIKHSGSTCRRKKGILMIRTLNRFFNICSCFIFVLYLFLLLLVFFVVLQSCKNMA